ncbi:MAG: cbb3-type cytochrome oxidase assembly protein CcoS [Halobacteriovoraceae bacterium]|jgi:cbb3-type cytochrome oxidase maturation protein|nr:cbb3-type cytochrome oxidase assembly protein CcoS [Halobacteriovoraceae bacterium]MBT5095036.1 cbb3-type cytochrome oxidase assembly protein CcoS [Halobacteriovoraceae bacterium]
MTVLYILLPLSIILGGIFLAAFIWSVNKGQYDDLETPAKRMLFEDENKN